jgi:hypothetical protein
MDVARSNAHIHQLYIRQVCEEGRFDQVKAAAQRSRSPHTTNNPTPPNHVNIQNKELDECIKVIDAVLAETGGQCDYAFHVKGLIERERGTVF